MSHWQALAVKISSSRLRSPTHCSCTFTCGGGDQPHSGPIWGPPWVPSSSVSSTPAPLTFLRLLMVQH